MSAPTLTVLPEGHYTRDEAIHIIRQELRRRSIKTWSVTGGRGTSWGWITIHAPPARRGEFGYMSVEDRAELRTLLGHASGDRQGISIPASSAHYREWVQRARGEPVTEIAKPYWD